MVIYQFFLFAEEEISLFWWKRSEEVINFGDALSPIVVEWILLNQVSQNRASSPRLFGIGSILHFAKDGDVIWGSGVNGKVAESSHAFTRLDVRAVRGPKTRAYLLSKGIDCPQVYGDPALLTSLIFPHLQSNPTKDFIVIPNLNEIDAYVDFPDVVLPTQDPLKVIQEILSAKLVISGALHGLIVAESFGVPAVYLRIKEIESLFKYEDYYLGTGREQFHIARTLEEALEIGGMPPPIYDKSVLIESFPYDKFIFNQ